jgi:hypothetical protein
MNLDIHDEVKLFYRRFAYVHVLPRGFLHDISCEVSIINLYCVNAVSATGSIMKVCGDKK